MQGATPCPLFVTPCPFEKAEMTPCPFEFFVFFKYQSHMAFSSVLPFLLPTHSVDCAVHLLLSHSRALLVSSALFHPFTALYIIILPFSFTQFTALKCPFDGPFTALKCPFQMAPCPFENLSRTLISSREYSWGVSRKLATSVNQGDTNFTMMDVLKCTQITLLKYF